MKLRNYGLDQIIKKALTVPRKTTILAARSILLRYKISRIIIAENGRPVGILTEKDLVKGIYNLGGRSIDNVKVSEFMTTRLVTATEDSTLYGCARLMLDHGISSIIIIKNDGRIAGIITKTDLSSVFLTQASTPLQVSKIMTKRVISVKPADSLLYVENVLVKNRISRVVVERDRKPVGIITHRDFIPAKVPLWIRQSGDSNEIERFRMSEKPHELALNQMSYLTTFIAADIMTPNPVTISATDDVSEASLLMVRNGISGLPVVRNSVLVGIITKTDIVRAIASGSP